MIDRDHREGARLVVVTAEELGRIVREAVELALRGGRGGDPGSELIPVDAWARRRSIATSTARRAIREGRLQAQRIGRAVRVRADAEIAAPVRATRAKDPAAEAQRILTRAGTAR